MSGHLAAAKHDSVQLMVFYFHCVVPRHINGGSVPFLRGSVSLQQWREELKGSWTMLENAVILYIVPAVYTYVPFNPDLCP